MQSSRIRPHCQICLLNSPWVSPWANPDRGTVRQGVRTPSGIAIDLSLDNFCHVEKFSVRPLLGIWTPPPPSPHPSLRKFSGSAHDPAILVHYIYLYLLYLKFDLSLMTFRRLRYSPFLSTAERSAYQLPPSWKISKVLSQGLCRLACISNLIFIAGCVFFFFGSFTCLRWCGESLLPLFVHFITAYSRRLARRSNFGAYEL